MNLNKIIIVIALLMVMIIPVNAATTNYDIINLNADRYI